jgi:hypothetical protein
LAWLKAEFMEENMNFIAYPRDMHTATRKPVGCAVYMKSGCDYHLSLIEE